jgi:phosphoribosylanthranilate isomerase
VKIKLCGFTDKESIKFALKYEPDFMGFIFYPPSKRNINLKQAREFANINFGKTKKIAVIVNGNDVDITQIIENLKPDFLQLHGEESLDRCLEIKRRFSLPIIKSIAIFEDLKISKILEKVRQYQNIADFLLFDSKTKEKGGSGKVFDWEILKKLNLKKDYFLSGGLDINNIAEAKKISGAKIFDLSSGIEEKKGVKSLEKIKNLMELFNELKKA